MGNNSSKKKEKYDKNVKSAMDREVDFAERLAYDRKLFNHNLYADTLNGKGGFLLSVYAKLTSSSIHLYKISRRVFLQKKSQKEPVRRASVIETQRGLETELGRGTAEWNNAKSAAQWLLHDYDVSFRTVMLSRHEQKEGNAENHQREQNLLADETKRLKMEALQVGFKYLDRNYSGFLEPSDIPDLPAHVYTRLDTTGKQSMSWKDIQNVIDNMENNVYKLRDEIVRLADKLSSQQSINNYDDPKARSQAEIDVLNTTEQYNRAVVDCNAEERVLNEVYALFRHAFMSNVFDVIPYSHADALPTLSRAVKETQHVDQVEPPKTTESWMTRIGSDILLSGSQNPMVLRTVPHQILQRDKNILDVPAAHQDASTQANIAPSVNDQVATVAPQVEPQAGPTPNLENEVVASNNGNGNGSPSSSNTPENHYRTSASVFVGNANVNDNFGNSVTNVRIATNTQDADGVHTKEQTIAKSVVSTKQNTNESPPVSRGQDTPVKTLSDV